MPISLQRLQRIRRFPELIDFLRDELDWPTDDFKWEDLTFEYEPAELGLKDEEAVKVKTIHQLRPLHQAQPWGIFFVEFGKKRIPIVVLRRILRHLVFKKRASANGAERPAWQARDLLFISATGGDADRELTFAHFVEQQETGLAELRVLGWDTDDTPLHMDYVAATLSQKLRWRAAYERDPEAWRREWGDAFRLRHRHVITKSIELAAALAEVARNIRTASRPFCVWKMASAKSGGSRKPSATVSSTTSPTKASPTCMRRRSFTASSRSPRVAPSPARAPPS